MEREFEHQVRAARTLRIIFPTVFALSFLILYLTYSDLAGAALMMLTVSEALAGGAFFMFLFPNIMHGWEPEQTAKTPWSTKGGMSSQLVPTLVRTTGELDQSMSFAVHSSADDVEPASGTEPSENPKKSSKKALPTVIADKAFEIESPEPQLNFFLLPSPSGRSMSCGW